VRIQEWQVAAVLEGTFLLDGGSMFGIVPRPLWSRRHPPDERNRIVMALRPLLLRHGARCILVDAGIGERFDERQQEIYRYQAQGGGLLPGLARLGVRPEQISDVVATHLHFDHVGGLLTRTREGSLRPTFPAATVHLQQQAWDWARSPTLWDQGSYFAGDFEVWDHALRLNLLPGDDEIAPGVRVQVTGGHVPGQQILVVGDGPGSLAYCADLIPTATHLRLAYIMAYDQQPLVTLEEKKVLLAQALEENWILAFEHDPGVAACRLREQDGLVESGEELGLDSLDS
jgi:glyoxylase-like metal-dependent hydrolase (beta-lactamase superfamily II)